MSRDRTLLANLAFADPDKQDPLHDLGCQYIARPEVSSLLGGGRPHPTERPRLEVPISKGQGQYKTTIGFLDVVLTKQMAKEEDVIHWRRSDSIFKSVNEARIFWDQLWEQQKHKWKHRTKPSFDQEAELRSEREGYRIYEFSCESTIWEPYIVHVEVKIAPVSLGDMLRQINLYNEYMWPRAWVLAAAFEMSSATVDTLHAHGILPVHLGKGFREWAAAQQALPRSTSVLSL